MSEGYGVMARCMCMCMYVVHVYVHVHVHGVRSSHVVLTASVISRASGNHSWVVVSGCQAV